MQNLRSERPPRGLAISRKAWKREGPIRLPCKHPRLSGMDPPCPIRCVLAPWVAYATESGGVNDNQPCVVFPDCPCDAFIGKGQWCVSIVNDKHFFKVCVCFHQSGLDRITQTVLGSLVNDIERFKGFHTGQGLSVGASRRKTHGKVGLALAGVALYDRQLSKGDIGKP